jgi:hypothetical protein
MGWSVTVIAEDLHGKKLPIKERVANYYVIRIPNAPLIHKKISFISNPLTLEHANIGFESKCCMRHMGSA